MKRFIPPVRRLNSKGSFLVEALLAIVIVSTALVFIVESLASSTSAMRQVSGFSTAVILAEDKMFELNQTGYVEAPMSEKGHFPTPYDQYRYELETTNISNGEDRGVKNEVLLEVFWPTGQTERKISLTTYLFDKESAEEK